LSDEKYRVHPIYSIPLFPDVRNKSFASKKGAVHHEKIPPKLIRVGSLMTDLFLQDFRDLVSENLAQILFSEKKNMFDEPKVPAKKRAVHRSCFSSFAGSSTKVRKSKEGRNVKK